MHATAHILTRQRNLLYPLGFRVPEFPSSPGYLLHYATAERARQKAYTSSRVFWLWICYTAHAIALTANPGDSGLPRWMRLLYESDLKLPTDWLDQLQNSSIICDFSGRVKRIGAVIHMGKEWQFIHVISFWKCAHVPTWFYWPSDLGPLPKLYQIFSPLPNQLRACVASLQEEEDIPKSAEYYDKVARQRIGETFEEFMDRRRKEEQILEAKEVDSARERRLARLSANCTNDGPVLTSRAKLFEWERIDHHPFYLRTLVTSDDREATWLEYSANQRVYSSFHNEWDCCWALAEDDTPDIELDDYVSHPDPVTALPPFIGDATNLQDNSSFDPSNLPAMDDRLGHLAIEPIRDILTFRYGINPATTYTNPNRNIRKELRSALDILVEKDMLQEILPSDRQWNITALAVIDLVRQATSQLHVDANLADISLPEDQFHSKYNIHRLCFSTLPRSGTRKYYVIDTSDCQQLRWKVAVHDPLTCGQILRCGWGPTNKAICLELSERGIPFSQLWMDTKLTKAYSYPWPLYLRPSNHCFTPQEYLRYQAIRDFKLKDIRVARAALRMGGIMWRLAVDSGVEVETIMKGNVNELGDEPTMPLGPYTFCPLSEELSDKLCGSYHLLTGKCFFHSFKVVLLTCDFTRLWTANS